MRWRAPRGWHRRPSCRFRLALFGDCACSREDSFKKRGLAALEWSNQCNAPWTAGTSGVVSHLPPPSWGARPALSSSERISSQDPTSQHALLRVGRASFQVASFGKEDRLRSQHRRRSQRKIVRRCELVARRLIRAKQSKFARRARPVTASNLNRCAQKCERSGTSSVSRPGRISMPSKPKARLTPCCPCTSSGMQRERTAGPPIN